VWSEPQLLQVLRLIGLNNLLWRSYYVFVDPTDYYGAD